MFIAWPSGVPAPRSSFSGASSLTTLAGTVGLVQVTAEDRTGYTRSCFKHKGAGTQPPKESGLIGQGPGMTTVIACLA